MTYGYLRVSTDKQDENNQKLGVDGKAKKLNLAIDEYIIDFGVSGTKEPGKRNLGGLLGRLNRGDTIIASELSRLGRSLFMVMRILEHCMKNGVQVITVKDHYELRDDIQSKVLAFAFSLAAEIERDLISQRTKEALERRRAAGIIFGRPRGSKTGSVKLKPFHDKIIEYLKAGISQSAMARLLGVNRNTVRKYCADFNLIEFQNDNLKKFKLAEKSPPRISTDELADLIEGGNDYRGIAEKIGKTENSVRNSIQLTPHLYDRYVKKQNAIRIEKNGGMRINKKAVVAE